MRKSRYSEYIAYPTNILQLKVSLIFLVRFSPLRSPLTYLKDRSGSPSFPKHTKSVYYYLTVYIWTRSDDMVHFSQAGFEFSIHVDEASQGQSSGLDLDTGAEIRNHGFHISSPSEASLEYFLKNKSGNSCRRLIYHCRSTSRRRFAWNCHSTTPTFSAHRNGVSRCAAASLHGWHTLILNKAEPALPPPGELTILRFLCGRGG